MDVNKIKKDLKNFIDEIEIPKSFSWLKKYRKTIITIGIIFVFFKWITSEE